LQVDVAAHWPRMQQTLHDLGFAPVAYCPAMVFEKVERLDVVKFVKLRVPWQLGELHLTDGARRVQELVERAFEDQQRGSDLFAVTRRVGLFAGLSDREIVRLQSVCLPRRYQAGEVVFEEQEASRSMFVVMSGAVDIVARDTGERLTTVGEGETFGEMALLEGLPRSASAVAKADCELLMMRAQDFGQLVDRDPTLGLRVMRNLARLLSQRLRATSVALGDFKRRLL